MADDLLTNIRAEIEARRRELRSSFDEYAELSAALAALSPDGVDPVPAGVRRAPRGRTVASKRAGGVPADNGAVAGGVLARGVVADGVLARAEIADDDVFAGRPVRPRGGARGGTRSRGLRTHTDRAVLAALEHGSHTVAELLVVTGLPARDIRESLRLMRMQRAIVTTDREGKTAYALPGDGGSA